MSIGKGRPLKVPKPRDVIFGKQAAPLFELFNAIINGSITDGQPSQLLIGENKIIWQIKGSGGNSSSGTYRGEYDPAGNTQFNPGPFVFGDEVRVSPTNANAAPAGTIIPGVYICVQSGPTVTNLPNHPLSPGGETAFWHWLATWPTAATQCNNDGSQSTYFIDEQKGN